MQKELVYILGPEKRNLNIKMRFMAEGFDVRFFPDVDRLVEEVAVRQPDLVLHTAYQGSGEGREFCMRLREKMTGVIILLGEALSDNDIVNALSLGADFCLTRSYNTSVLVAQIHACFRRSKLNILKDERKSRQEYLVNTSDLKINVKSRTVIINYKAVALTAWEFNILALLASHPNQVFYTNQIFQSVWDADSILNGDVRPVSVHISNLRKKIEKDPVHPRFIITVRGVGYKFQAME